MKGTMICGTIVLLVLVLGCWETPVVNDHEHERKVRFIGEMRAEG